MSSPGPRKEQGDAETSQRNPPHTDVNAKGAPLQTGVQAPNDVPTQGATAHGRDKGGEGPGHIDEASAYERRPGEDKDRAETEMP